MEISYTWHLRQSQTKKNCSKKYSKYSQKTAFLGLIPYLWMTAARVFLVSEIRSVPGRRQNVIKKLYIDPLKIFYIAIHTKFQSFERKKEWDGSAFEAKVNASNAFSSSLFGKIKPQNQKKKIPSSDFLQDPKKIKWTFCSQLISNRIVSMIFCFLKIWDFFTFQDHYIHTRIIITIFFSCLFSALPSFRMQIVYINQHSLIKFLTSIVTQSRNISLIIVNIFSYHSFRFLYLILFFCWFFHS